MIWHVKTQCSDTNQVCFLQLFVRNLSVYGILIRVGMLCVVSCLFFCILLNFLCILLHLLSWFCTYSFIMASDRIKTSCVFLEENLFNPVIFILTFILSYAFPCFTHGYVTYFVYWKKIIFSWSHSIGFIMFLSKHYWLVGLNLYIMRWKKESSSNHCICLHIVASFWSGN